MKFDSDRAAWRKSTYSGTTQSECVEVGPSADAVGVRDTTRRDAGHLAVSRTAWQAFVTSVRM